MVAGREVAKGQLKTYANTLGVVTSGVTNAGNAVLQNETFATITGGALGGTASVQVLFASPVPANTLVYVKVSTASSVGVTAYSGGTTTNLGTPVTITTSSAILNAPDNSNYYIAISSASAFNSVKVEVTGALLGSNTANLFYVFYNQTNPADCGTGMSTSTTTSGVLVGGGITSPNNAIDADPNSFAYLTLGTLAVAGTVTESIYFSGPSNAGDAVRTTFSIPQSVLSLGLLSNVSVQAYKGLTPIGTPQSLGALLTLDLLGLLNNGAKYTFYFVPGQAFDRVEFTVGGVVSLLGGLNLYDVQRVPSPLLTNESALGVISVCGTSVTLSILTPQSGVTYNWYNVATGGSILATGTSYNVTGLTTGTTSNYYVEAIKPGCSNSVRVPFQIKSIAPPVVNPNTGPAAVCTTQSITLSNTTPSGVWSSSDNTIATVNSSGLVAGVAAGTATISYTVTDATTGCTNAATTLVTVSTFPSAGTITGTNLICAQKTATLTSSVNGGTWSSSDVTKATINSTSGLLTGVAAGTVTITYTVNNGTCSNNTTMNVQVNALPTVNPITGTTSVCVGKTTTLANTTVNGTWSSDNTNVATVNSSGLVTGVTAGTANISYTVSDGLSSNCTNAASATVTVNPLPIINPITGTTAVCVNATTQLASTTNGGVWSSSDATKATVNSSGLVTGVAAGTATITYTVTNGSGCTTAVTTSVTINALPVVAPITGTPSVCVNATTQLASTTNGGVWSSSDATKATVNSSGLVSGVAAGTATITYTVTNGSGCTTVVTSSVTINALPSITLGPVPNTCQENSSFTLTYTFTSGAPTSYSIIWDSTAQSKGFVNNSNTPFSGGSITITKPTGPLVLSGTYNGTLTVNNGTCTSAMVPISVTVTPKPPSPSVSLHTNSQYN
ncbi:beta strand repeat-containing protein [Pedobacter nutrimenti]|uniref:Ig-like protein group 2 n=1 Tax=Pedobacter nutrimenti TaxID=1241337 RepID=A0A318UMF3_9SPHI|nr:Ig-like domain-containing protein [Pedobacter nutrimenti]PYF76710.1 Ig-like protein group 2 [Pedobacter nutrimenti]